MPDHEFQNLQEVAQFLRNDLSKPKRRFTLLYAHNATGKTRLSGAFKDIGKAKIRDTLYFNAYTEDLFYWDNDLENDRERILKLNVRSNFFDALKHIDINSQLRPLIKRYVDLEFRLDQIDKNEWRVSFSRDVLVDGRLEELEDIKISRGEENIFIWCFFLAIVQLVLDDDGTGPYNWVKYLYIDDPVSSLDETNAISVASHLGNLLTKSEKGPQTIISTHHGLFFNVLGNEFKKGTKSYFLKSPSDSDNYILSDITNKFFLQHLTTLQELDKARISGNLKRHHFNLLRCSMEQTAIFLGFENWKECIKLDDNDPDKALCERMINVMSHGDYLILDPEDLVKQHKGDFQRFFQRFVDAYPFTKTLFASK